MDIKPVTFNDPKSWVQAVYAALDEVEMNNLDHDEVMTAMAWICESLDVDIMEID